MKIIDVAQGTDEWLACRLGMPTASCFDKIIQPRKLKYSASASGYRDQLLAERMLGQPLEEFDGTMWTNRGTSMEAEAIAYFQLIKDVEVRRVGFCTTDDGRVGCSPDGLVGENGGLEIKCRGAKAHMGTLMGADPATATQVQGSLLVTERDYWDMLSYNPAFPPTLIRVYRDEPFIAALSGCLVRFLEELDEGQRKLDTLGKVGRVEIRERVAVSTE